ncbi:hypothetical protein BDY19DRAFT_972605 [Irpex rosettiformis]|uniref:Uncharacterized protein n=1 Tax=Irpex rosettiformis TaxID=378272 RepID=A0ACB8TQQ9_9APHY|nr:hypothetical protein BDY19DRAFT_972605 [Irpex rosettiformis]
MIILEEKMPPPPPYTPPPSASVPTFPPPFSSGSRQKTSFTSLPSHLLLRIVYATFAHTKGVEGQRKTLYWLTMNLRMVNRSLYFACMHILRSTYLPAYNQLVKPPYTSDPFASALSTKPGGSFMQALQRETRVLDLFVVLKVREDVWADETELHLERDESFRDLFDLMQPRSRLEDLVRIYGEREGLIYTDDGSSSVASTSRSKSRKRQLPFDALSVSFSSRRVGLVLTTSQRKRTIVEVERRREEKLEYAARGLVHELKSWIRENT